MELDNFKDIMDMCVEGFTEQKNKTLAFLILSRAVYDNISPKQVLHRYEVEEVYVEPKVMDFRDMKNRPLKFKVETQVRLVPRKKRICLDKYKWLDCKVSLLQTLDKVFNAKQVKDETDSNKQQ